MIKCKKCKTEFKKDMYNSYKLFRQSRIEILCESGYEIDLNWETKSLETVYKCPNCGELNKEEV